MQTILLKVRIVTLTQHIHSKEEASKINFVATAKVTRLGLDFNTPVGDNKVGGKVEVDFAGTSDNLRIRHAYLTLNNWLFGQTTSRLLASVSCTRND